MAMVSPNRCTAEVGTDGQHDGSSDNHRLVEMGWGQCLFDGFAAGDDDTVEL